MTDIAVFSFFSGAGFLDLGFENAGIEVCYVNEYHQPFVDGYKYYRQKIDYDAPRFGYEVTSIEDIKIAALATNLKKMRAEDKVVGFIGGPPCPDFSIGGKNRGKSGDNGRLSSVYTDLISLIKPDFFVFENVKGLYRTKIHREFFDGMKKKLSVSGYTLHERLINSIEYGAPQDRERIILTGFLDPLLAYEFSWGERPYPERTAFEHDWPTADPFGVNTPRLKPNGIPLDLTVQYWFDKNSVKEHPNAMHCFKPRAGLVKFLAVDEGDDSKKSYKRLHRWRYSPTAAYGNNEVHLHPYEARRISVAEALAIQSLPKDFELPPSMSLSNMFKTVGNGVPYLAALGIANSIKNHLGVDDASDSTKSGEGNQRSAA